MTDDVDSTELAVGAEDLEVHRSTGGIEPSTRRWIVAALATIALAALVAEIILAIVESSRVRPYVGRRRGCCRGDGRRAGPRRDGAHHAGVRRARRPLGMERRSACRCGDG